MYRYKLIIEYDGTDYCGWQRQQDHYSIQEAIEQAVLRFSGQEVRLTTAGRTDAGVHASAQVAHVDLAKNWAPSRVMDAINAHLKLQQERIAILSAEAVDLAFNARFSATKRHYLYKIINRRAPLALAQNRAWWLPKPLDIEAMQQGAAHLIGYHDFTTFRAVQCQALSPMRSLDQLEVIASGGDIHIHASARSFLHNQVRSMVGSLTEVGSGRWQPKDIKSALDGRDRKYCGVVAPAYGLYLTKVEY